MPENPSLLFDWLPEKNIESGLKAVHQLPTPGFYALITCIDSSPETYSILKGHVELDFDEAEMIDVMGAAFLTFDRAMSLIDSGFFNGFDELWVVKRQPTRSPRQIIAITSERSIPEILRRCPPAAMLDITAWMLEANCLIGLGDGAGLNCITMSTEAVGRMNRVRSDEV